MDTVKDTISAIIQELNRARSDLDSLKNEVASLQTQVNSLLNPTQTKRSPKTASRTHRNASSTTSSIYLPELDYLLWITYLRDEFRKGQKSGGKTMYLPKHSSQTQHKLSIVYGYLVTDIDTTPAQTLCTIPSASMRQDLTLIYGVRYQEDFRFIGTQAVYTRGIFDRDSGGLFSGTSSCAVFNKTANFKMEDRQQITANTREHWYAQTDEAKRMRIVDEEEMERILDKLENGTYTPGQGMWSMDEPRDPTARETDDTYWLSPRRVRLL